MRRLDAGEAIERLPCTVATPAAGGSRCRFRACRDGAEGWVTTKGSKGNEFVRPGQRHYICLKDATLHESLGANSKIIHTLKPGEAFAAFEEPRAVTGGKTQKVE